MAAHHARLRVAHDWLAHDPGRVERLWRSLRALPSLRQAFGAEWGQAEVALCAAFRHEQAQIARELRAEDLGAWLALAPENALDDGVLGADKDPSFYLDDARSPELSALRARIKTLDTAREAAEEAQRRALCARHGLPASLDSWLVSRKDTALVAALEDDLELRRAEEGLTLVRYARQPTTELLALHERLAEALHEERRVEQALYAELGARLLARETLWKEEEEKLARLDLLLAMAECWQTGGGELPLIARVAAPQAAPLDIHEGRNSPLAARLAKDGAGYVPLDLTLVAPLCRAGRLEHGRQDGRFAKP